MLNYIFLKKPTILHVQQIVMCARRDFCVIVDYIHQFEQKIILSADERSDKLLSKTEQQKMIYTQNILQ